jgi:hypothetical protein
MRQDQQARELVSRPPVEDDAIERMRAVDEDNTAWLKKVIDRQGWPARSAVGDQAALAAWLLAQHADHDVDFQRRCLVLLAEAVRHGEADPAHLAYLTDRVLCAESRPQRYGTQFWRDPDGTGRLEPRPIEDPDRLDERRRSVGLEPFAEYDRRMREQDTDRR